MQQADYAEFSKDAKKKAKKVAKCREEQKNLCKISSGRFRHPGDTYLLTKRRKGWSAGQEVNDYWTVCVPGIASLPPSHSSTSSRSMLTPKLESYCTHNCTRTTCFSHKNIQYSTNLRSEWIRARCKTISGAMPTYLFSRRLLVEHVSAVLAVAFFHRISLAEHVKPVQTAGRFKIVLEQHKKIEDRRKHLNNKNRLSCSRVS